MSAIEGERIYRRDCGEPECTACPERDQEGYDREGYDDGGFDRDGYNRSGWNRNRMHRNGTEYDDAGYDIYGYDSEGYNRYGRDDEGYDRDGYDSDGYDRDNEDRYGNPRPCDCGYCEECRGEEDDSDVLHYYSYTPRLKFRGERPPYYGMEIEVTTDRRRRLVETVQEYAGDLIYCKSDSSVDGAELVTHPMSFDWAMANFPWNVLPALRDTADATIIPQENGIHVHVSRDGFDSPAHMFRWLKFWYRNPGDIQRIARRASDNWAAFRPDHRAAQVQHVKRDKPGYDRYADDTRETRYAAINTTNDDTLEVRVFASTLRPNRARAALQLVAGTVEFTRQLTADDVCHRHGWDWKAFASWAGKDGRYPDLVTQDRVRAYR